MGDADPVGSSGSRFLGWEGTPGPAAAPLCCGIPQDFCRNGISGGVSQGFPRSHTGMGHGAARAERPEWFSLRKSWECVPGISLELLFPSRELRPPSPGFLQPWEFPPLPAQGQGLDSDDPCGSLQFGILGDPKIPKIRGNKTQPFLDSGSARLCQEPKFRLPAPL